MQKKSTFEVSSVKTMRDKGYVVMRIVFRGLNHPYLDEKSQKNVWVRLKFRGLKSGFFGL